MIWHIAVHPNFQRMGIGEQLLRKAEMIALEKGLNHLEAWTRDDKWVNQWYLKNKFVKKDSYYHVFMEGSKEVNEALRSSINGLQPVQTFAHYNGSNPDKIKNQFNRVHECNCYVKQLV